MNRQIESALLIVGLFALAGGGIGIVGFLTTGEAHRQFLEAATGPAAEFGPAFVAQVVFQTAVVVLFVAPALGVVLGVLVGSRFYEAATAALVCGGAGLVGSLLMVVLAVSLASLGTDAATAWSSGTVVATAAAGVVTSIAGAVASVAGVELAG